MTTTRRCAATLAAILLLHATASCAVPLQDRPQVIDTDRRAPAETIQPDPTAEPQADTSIYVIRGGRLVRVTRQVPAGNRVENTLASLLAGTLPAEESQQLRTAIPAAVTKVDLRTDGHIAIMRVPAAFLALSGPEQVLAVAQLVWTVTDTGEATGLRLIDNSSTPVALPVEGGDLVYRPVRRTDYHTLSPT